MSRSGPVLISRNDDQARSPYRAVWIATAIESTILVAVTVGLFLLNPQLRGVPLQVASAGIALLPLALWIVFSLLAERRAPQPRQGLLAVLALSAVLTNGVALPLQQRFFTPEIWLSTAPGLSRIIGYMLTVGIVQEFIKYAAVQYTVFPQAFRVRMDGIAYAITAGVGCATMLNLNLLLTDQNNVATIALRVCEITLAQVSLSLIVGFFMGELGIREASAFSVPIGVVIAALLNALTIVGRAGLIIGAVSPTSTASNPLQGISFVVGLLVVLMLVFRFLITNADERDQLRSRE